MLRGVEDLEGCAVGLSGGVVGHVEDLYFDDEAWIVRYFGVDTGGWLSSRKVLISLDAGGKRSSSQRVLPVSLTRETVKNSPDIDTKKPVSRQHEKDYLDGYGDLLYWGARGFWGGGIYPAAALAETQSEPDADSHLRRCQTVGGYHVHASDGDIGHV